MFVKTTLVGGLALAFFCFFIMRNARNRYNQTRNGYELDTKYGPPDSSEYFDYPPINDTTTEPHFRIVLSRKSNATRTVSVPVLNQTSLSDILNLNDTVDSEKNTNNISSTITFETTTVKDVPIITAQKNVTLFAPSSSTPRSIRTTHQSQYLYMTKTSTISPVWSNPKTRTTRSGRYSSKSRTQALLEESVTKSHIDSQSLNPSPKTSTVVSHEIITEGIPAYNNATSDSSKQRSESVTEYFENESLSYLPPVPTPSALLAVPESISAASNSTINNSFLPLKQNLTQPSKLYLPPRQA